MLFLSVFLAELQTRLEICSWHPLTRAAGLAVARATLERRKKHHLKKNPRYRRCQFLGRGKEGPFFFYDFLKGAWDLVP